MRKRFNASGSWCNGRDGNNDCQVLRPQDVVRRGIATWTGLHPPLRWSEYAAQGKLIELIKLPRNERISTMVAYIVRDVQNELYSQRAITFPDLANT